MTTDMPWNRFPEEEEELPFVPPPPPAPPPELPVVPEPVTSTPPPGVEPSPDVASLAKDLLAEALNYAKATWSATVAGKEVDHANPTITAETKQGHELVVADARSRSWRTLLQGLGIDLIFGLTAVLATLSGADLMQKETWFLLGALLIKTALTTLASYVMRLKVTPTVRTKGEKMQVVPLMVPKPPKKREEEFEYGSTP